MRPPMQRDDLLSLSVRSLRGLFAEGHPIDPRALEGFEYRGVSLGIPAVVKKITWTTFQKAFHRDRSSGHLRGWNVRIEQRGLDAESVALVKHGTPITFGHFRVVDPKTRTFDRVPGDYDRGLL